MSPIPYKYKLKELFTAKFGGTEQDAKEFFANHYQISLRTVQRDLSITINEVETVPAGRLQQYAQYLSCQAAELRNYKTIKESWPL